MPLSRHERERLVLDLYNQGKNIREIAQEARMSFSAIGTILKKEEQENETSKGQTEKMSQAAQAYKLFSDGKSPVDVAITLNLRQAQVTEFYREYWKLKQLYDLNQVYEEIKGDISSFVDLYKLAKAAGMNTQQVIRLLTIANNHLPLVEHRYQELQTEDEKKNIVMNVYQSGIGEIFIALQLDLEIPTFIGTSKEYNICKGDFQEKIN